jgi:hypothetical protein
MTTPEESLEEMKKIAAEIARVSGDIERHKAEFQEVVAPAIATLEKAIEAEAGKLAANNRIADALTALAAAQTRIAVVFEGEMTTNETVLERIASALEIVPQRIADAVTHGLGQKIT